MHVYHRKEYNSINTHLDDATLILEQQERYTRTDGRAYHRRQRTRRRPTLEDRMRWLDDDTQKILRVFWFRTCIPLLSLHVPELLLSAIACFNVTMLLMQGWDVGAANILVWLVPVELLVLSKLSRLSYILHVKLVFMLVLLGFVVANRLQETNFGGMSLLLAPFFPTPTLMVPHVMVVFKNPLFYVWLVILAPLQIAIVFGTTIITKQFPGVWSRICTSYLVFCLVFALVVRGSTLARQKYLNDRFLKNFQLPPTPGMRSKPSIALVAVDADDLSAINAASLSHHPEQCIEWDQHDSGAFTSEQGFASLFYGVQGPTQEDFQVFDHNHFIQSWILYLFHRNGYHTHRIMSVWNDFGTVLEQPSALQMRDFTSYESVPDGMEMDRAIEWIRENKDGQPYFLSVDLGQDDKEQVQEEVATDVQLAALLDEVYADGHNKNGPGPLTIFTSYHSQKAGEPLGPESVPPTRVPLVICGDGEILRRALPPTNQVTSHASLLARLAKACRTVLTEEWDFLSEVGFSYSRHPWSPLDVLRFNPETYVVRDGDNIEAVGSSPNTDIDNVVRFMDAIQQKSTWPGSTRPKATDYSSRLPFIKSSDAPSRRKRELSVTVNSKGIPDTKLTIDVVSIGTTKRQQNLLTQMKTWASTRHVREFRGYTEMNDFNQTCHQMTDQEAAEHIEMCRMHDGWGTRLRVLIVLGYTRTEKGFRKEAGWLCAQRRIALLFEWIASYEEERMPDFLVTVDDDTSFDVDVLQDVDPNSIATAGCLIPRVGMIPWLYPYGGFGFALSKEALRLMARPIYCRGHLSSFERIVCSSMERNELGEQQLFSEGMSIAELFLDYAALGSNCVHSDWLVGYVVENYLGAVLGGLSQWPTQCSNTTHYCSPETGICHNQDHISMQTHYEEREMYKLAAKHSIP